MQKNFRIDTHVHLWDPQKGYGWLSGGDAVLRREYGIRELTAEAARAGVRRAVVIEANRGDATENTDNLERAGKSDLVGGVIASGCHSDPALEGEAAVLERWPGGEKFRGFRDSRSHAGRPADSLAARPGALVLEVMAPWRDPDGFARYALRAPHQSLVLDHLGCPPADAGDHVRWFETMLALSRIPNVVCKVSGLLTLAGHDEGSDADARLLTVLRAFGPTRIVAGSDWPVCLLGGSYEDALRAALALCTRALPAVTADRIDRNAVRVYSISDAPKIETR
jgi:L-fuconolactonase